MSNVVARSKALRARHDTFRGVLLTAVGLLFLVLGPFLLSADDPSNFSADGIGMFAAAESLAMGDGLSISAADYGEYRGADGRTYGQWGVGQSLVELPFVAVARQIALVRRETATEARRFALWAASLAIAATKAGVVAMLFLLSCELSGSLRRSICVALAAGFCSPLWSLGQGFSEPFQTLLLAVGLYGLLRQRMEPWMPGIVMAASAFGMALLTKPPLFVWWLGGSLYLYVTSRQWQRSKRRTCGTAWTATVVLFLGAWLYINYQKFGGSLAMGYSRGRQVTFGFNTPVLTGLYGFGLSSGKSVFLYCPLLVVSVWGWRALWRSHRAFSTLVFGCSAVMTVMFAKWWAWHGDHAWGPRFLLPLIVVGLLGLVSPEIQGRVRVATAALAVVAMVIQVPAILLTPELYFKYSEPTIARLIPSLAGSGGLEARDNSYVGHFVPEFSPVWFQYAAAARMIERRVGIRLPCPWGDGAPWGSLGRQYVTKFDDGDLVWSPMVLTLPWKVRNGLLGAAALLSIVGLMLIVASRGPRGRSR